MKNKNCNVDFLIGFVMKKKKCNVDFLICFGMRKKRTVMLIS